MVTKFFLAGHIGFHNRGCEALVRSMVTALTERLGPCEFVAPSTDIEADRRQWPDASRHGVRFVPFYRIPDQVRWWGRLMQRAPSTAAWWWPLPDVPAAMAQEIASSDAVIVTGGDVLSLDYSIGSLLRWVAQAEAGLRRDVPLILWSSSIGPFGSNPAVERRLIGHLARYSVLSTRESHSQAYMQKLGLASCVQTVDPAFLLQPATTSVTELMPEPGPNGILGFNVSPVMARARARFGGLEELEREIIEFWRVATRERGLSLALIPHVESPDDRPDHSDAAYMRGLLQRATGLGLEAKLLPSSLNAAQLKTALAACTYFIGARTHATIGALSCGVPTLSIAYSVKAKGINQDLFGHLRYLIETPSVSLATLDQGLQTLMTEGAAIRDLLADRIPTWRRKAAATADLVVAALRAHQREVVA